MTPERWKQVEEIFNAALERPVDEREAMLGESCGNDPSLRAQVEYLIQCHEQAGDFIEGPAATHDSLLADEGVTLQLDSMVGRQVGAYRLIREIGRGGMGAVYLAARADKEFRQRAAIKLVKRGMDTDFVIRRFRNERQILAALNHPNIARLLDGGTTDDGLPYFVMEYIEGLPIHRYCDKNRLDLRERLRLFRQVCAAISYAHENQVIHRDIKPGNILVTEDGAPKLLDFGIAKILDPDLAADTLDPTVTAMRLMTPEYASPEQARGEQVTAETDQYSLGVLLYELLTGHRPYQIRGRAPYEIARIISEEEPERPSDVVNRARKVISSDGRREITLSPEEISRDRSATPDELRRALAGDLDDIVMQALRKDRRQRYDSVYELSQDINRYLEDLPIAAERCEILEDHTTVSEEAAPATQPNSIAILPFKLMVSPEAESEDDRFLCLGLADALITRLSNIRSLVVRPTSSIMKYYGEHGDALIAGMDLQVGYVLDGRIFRSTDRLRVSVQLVNIKTASPHWAAQFDEKYTDILDLQDSISDQLSQAILENLSGEERARLAKRGTNDLKAWELYMRGRQHWHSYTEDGLARAITCFYEAIAIDSNFAAAHAGVADYFNWLGISGVMPPVECFKAAKVSAMKALELDNRSAEAHASLGLATWAYDWDAAAAERLFRKAMELSDGYAQTYEWNALLCSAQGRHDQALALMRRALEIDPLSPSFHTSLSSILRYADRLEEAVQSAERALEIDPEYYRGLWRVAGLYQDQGRSDEALAAARRAVEHSGRAPVTLRTLAHILALCGEESEARALLDELRALSSTRYIPPCHLALIYTGLNEPDAAFDRIDEALEDHDYWALWLPVEPRYSRLRSDPRFAAAVSRLGPSRGGDQVGQEKVERRRVRTRSASKPMIAVGGALALIASLVAFIHFVLRTPNEKPVTVSTTATKSIVVLPFRPKLPSETEKLLGVGLADVITNKLGQIKQLTVRPASASRSYLESDFDAYRVGSELGVEYVISGALRRDGERLSIELQTFGLKENKIVWSAKIDEKLTDIGSLQNFIAEGILRSLTVEPTGAERKFFDRRYTENNEAYQLYLTGRYHWGRRSFDGFKEAIKAFSEAIEKDPNFALAYAGLADCYALLQVYHAPSAPSSYGKAKESALKALALDDSLAEAHASLAYVKFYFDRDRRGAEASFRRAIELNPSYATAHHWLAIALSAMGRHDEAIAEIKEAERLDPRSAVIKSAAGMNYAFARQFDRGLDECRRALELDPALFQAYRVTRWIYQAMGRYDEAFAAYQKEKALSGDANVDWPVILAQLQAIGGQREKAMASLKRGIGAPPPIRAGDYRPYEIAIAYELLGDRDQALAWLAKPETIGSNNFNSVMADPRLYALRADPRFVSLMKKTGLQN